MKRNQGPKHPKECKGCKWWNPHSEAYACEFCEAKARQDRTANIAISLKNEAYQRAGESRTVQDLLAQYHRMLCRLLMELDNADQITDWQEWKQKVADARHLIEKGNALNLWEADKNS